MHNKIVAPLGHIILIPSQPLFGLTIMLHALQRSTKYQFNRL